MLATEGAMRAGAGMVRLGVPGATNTSGRPAGHWPTEAPSGCWPIEAVRFPLPDDGWADRVLLVLERCRALVVGPGLGRDEHTLFQIRRLVSRAKVPVVVDADALYALGDIASACSVVSGDRPVVVTPHDGEYARLVGVAPGPDRVAAARHLASSLGATALVKGSLSVIASPSGEVILCGAGSSRLATAGTGDVLSGVIGAFLALGLTPLRAAALGAHAHGRAAAAGLGDGLVAGDLPALIAAYLAKVLGG